MAAVASRSLPRLSTAMHTTSTLLPQALTPAATRPFTLTPKGTRPSTRTPTPTLAYTRTPNSRTITSFQGLQSQPEPWKIVEELHIPEDVEEEEEATGLHLEAVQEWLDSFDLNCGSCDALDFNSREEVKLTDTLYEEDLLDIRRGWVATTDY